MAMTSDGLQNKFSQITARADPNFSNFANGLMGMFSGKGKGAPRQPQQMQVPQATGGFYQPSNSADRSQLLQAMMQRSRMGRNQGA